MRVFLLAFVLPLLGIASCPPYYPTRVLLIGDSITAGVGSGPGYLSEQDSFAAIVSAAEPERFEFVNLGCSGAETTDWVVESEQNLCWPFATGADLWDVMLAPILPYAPRAFVMLGTNDASDADGTPSSPASYRENLVELLRRLDGNVASATLLPPPPWLSAPAAVQERLAAYRSELAALCADPPELPRHLEIRCADPELGPNDAYLGNAHPNASGHDKIAGAVLADLGVR